MDNTFIALETIDFNQIESILTKIKPIAEEYNKEDIKPPFNIILAASENYYYENYHSDIMAYILKNKPETIKYFIEYINGIPNAPKDMIKIDENNYKNIEVKREKYNIDILIRDLTSRHCIIVENKIKNAIDMPQQLPNYYREMKKQEYTVDVLLYYSFDGTKSPIKSTWSDEDKELVKNKIVFGAAANKTGTDYINAFLIKCKNNTKDEQEKAFYWQYIDLLDYLRRKNQMNDQPMEEFYKEMLKPDQYVSALCIRNMLYKFIEFRRDQIRDYFQNNHSPFEDQSKTSNGIVYEKIREISEERIKLDIYSDEKTTTILFWIQEPKTELDLIKKILEKIGEYDKFKQLEKNKYVYEFEFPKQEKEMYEYITKFFSLLDENKDKINL